MFLMVVFVWFDFLRGYWFDFVNFSNWVLLFAVTRAIVPRMNLDDLFEQKGEVAKAVLEELHKVINSLLAFVELSSSILAIFNGIYM